MFKVKDGKSGLEFYRTDKEGNILTIDRSPKWKKLREKTELKEMYIVRYADDFKIFCRDYVTAKKAMYATKLWLTETITGQSALQRQRADCHYPRVGTDRICQTRQCPV